MSSFSGGDDEPSAAEWAVMAVSVAVTFLLFGYVAWHAVTTATATPEATVTGTQTTDDGRVVVIVEVHSGDTGLESVTAEVDCANESITFSHVPTDASRSGRVVCPAGTEDPSASVVRWIET